jgi:hypothetical protein
VAAAVPPVLSFGEGGRCAAQSICEGARLQFGEVLEVADRV